MRLLSLLVVLAVAGCSAATDALESRLPGASDPGPAASGPSVDVTGTWEGAEWGPMRLTQDTLGAVRGALADYDYQTTVSGTVSGNRLVGTWIAPDGNSACEVARGGSRYHGRIEFEFVGDTFRGRYSNCDADPNYFEPDGTGENGPYVEGQRIR